MTSQTQDWRSRARAKKQQQRDSIPKEWILTNPPGNDQLNVIDVPRTCGLLSSKEIEITESHVEVLLSNLATGNWSAVEVATAFSKRAIIAHQLVCVLFIRYLRDFF
jgi:amidase